MLKQSAAIHLPCIMALVNASFQQGVFPNALRTLLEKETLRVDELKNYLPVSNISFISKVTVYFAAKIVRLVMAVETTFADLSSQIYTRLTGSAGNK